MIACRRKLAKLSPSSPVAIDPVTVERDIAAQGFRTWRIRIIPLLAQFTRMRTVQTYGADHPNAAE